MAVEAGLELIPALNKIDLPGAEPERVAAEIARADRRPTDDILRDLGEDRRGRGRGARADRRADPAARAAIPTAPPRALIFDSEFDQYRGVVAYVRVVDGVFRKGEAIRTMVGTRPAEIDEIGFFSPADARGRASSHAGEVGYLITGIKDVTQLRVGDTLTTRANPARRAAAGLPRGQADGLLRPLPDRLRALPRAARRAREADAQRRRAVVGAGELGRARLRLPRRLPRASCTWTSCASAWSASTTSSCWRRCPRCGFEVTLTNGEEVEVHNPSDMPDPGQHRRDPRAVHPRHDHRARREFIGAVMELCQERRGNARRHALPLARARAADLRHAAGGDRDRLLRPAEVAHPRLRLARLRADRHGARRTSSSSTCCSAATRSTRSR